MSDLACWFVHARDEADRLVSLVVAASSARSAQYQVRQRLGPAATITAVDAVRYANAWVIDLARTRPAARRG